MIPLSCSYVGATYRLQETLIAEHVHFYAYQVLLSRAFTYKRQLFEDKTLT